jgi:glycosyltransferase EpsF
MKADPKRVLHIIPTTALGGTSVFVMNLYRKIDRSKLQFDFISFNKGCLDEEITSLGGRVFYFEWMKKKGLFGYFQAVKKIIKENGPYIAVHSHQGYKAGISLLAAKSQRIENRICHIHAINAEVKWHRYIMFILRFISIHYATKLLACSKTAGEFLYKKRKFTVIPNAIDNNPYFSVDDNTKYKVKSELSIPYHKLVIGHVGRFAGVKNHIFLLDIAEKLKSQNLDFIFLLVGVGPLFEKIETEVINKNLGSHFLLLKQRKDIPRIMSALDIFICPSFFESFSIVLLEAQAAGVPCLASTGIPDSVDLKLGLVKFLDLELGAEAWTKQLLLMKNIEKIEKKLVKEALIRNNFDTNSNTNIMLKIYNL